MIDRRQNWRTIYFQNKYIYSPRTVKLGQFSDLHNILLFYFQWKMNILFLHGVPISCNFYTGYILYCYSHKGIKHSILTDIHNFYKRKSRLECLKVLKSYFLNSLCVYWTLYYLLLYPENFSTAETFIFFFQLYHSWDKLNTYYQRKIVV